MTSDQLGTAMDLIAKAEADLGPLSDGQRRDLLMDNTDFGSDLIRKIVEEIRGELPEHDETQH